jgi:hypothetical protein
MINTFDELLAHAGHETETVYYGAENQAVNAAIECITCGCVLVDLSPGDLLSKELAEDVGKTIAHVWTIDDVLMRARQNDINLSEQQAKEILARVDHGKDAEYGINWGTLDFHTNGYLKDMSGG